MLLLCICTAHFMLSMAITSQTTKFSKHIAASNVNYTVQESHFQSLSDSLVASAIITLLTFIVKRVRICMIGSESGLDSIKILLNHIRFSYNKSSTKFYKIFRRYIFWSSVLNIVLLLLCNMSIKNPGPAKNLTVYYQNVRGLIPWSDLGNSHPNLDQTKISELQLYLYSQHPDVVILNETWLKPCIKDNEIIREQDYKIFRLDRNENTHPMDPDNPSKFRKMEEVFL